MKQVQLTGIDCAACAIKIESNVKRLPNVKSCSVNFATQKLNYELTGNQAATVFETELADLLKKTEPDVMVQSTNQPEPTSQKWSFNVNLIRIIASALLLGLSYLPAVHTTGQVLLLLSAFLIIGYDIIWKAVFNIFHGQWFDENFLMSVATIGAFGIGQYAEAVGVMLFYQVGEYFQTLAINHSRQSIASLVAIKPAFANQKTTTGLQRVAPESVQVGETIVVKPGEKVPLDGIVIDGTSFVNTAAITGESVPRAFKSGDTILSGGINQSGLLSIEVTKPYADSTVAKILDLVENASSQKAPTENFITRFAKVYTPIVVGFALLLAIVPPYFSAGFSLIGYTARSSS